MRLWILILLLIPLRVFSQPFVAGHSGESFTIRANIVSTANSSDSTLEADEVFTGTMEDIRNTAVIIVTTTSDVASATDGLSVEFSSNGEDWDNTDVFTIRAGAAKTFSFQPSGTFMRVVYTNGGDAQSYFRLQTILKPTYVKPSSHRIQDSIVDEDDAELVKAVITGEDNTGNFIVFGTNNPQPVIDLNGTAIAQGNLSGYSNVQKFGHNPALGTTLETIWGEDSLYLYPAAATQMTVSSSDVDDDTAGTGALTVEILGLNANYVEVMETLAIGGQDPVTTDSSYLRVFRAIVKTAGSSGWNEGTIYVGTGAVVSGVPENVFTIIEPFNNQTLQAFYTIPANKTGYITKWYMTIGNGKELTSFLVVRPLGEVFQVKQEFILYQTPFVIDFSVPLRVEEKSDIEIRGMIEQLPATGVSSSFDIILIDD